MSSNYCGVGQPNGAGGGGKRSMSFDGLLNRSASTEPLDVSNGGWLEAELFIPPPGYDVTNPMCRSAYQGTVLVSYSLDDGEWFPLARYSPMDQPPQSVFFPIKIVLPSEAISKSTSFRFSQPTFEAGRDNWALDNVRVFSYFPGDWKSGEFEQNVQAAHTGM